MTVNKQIAAYIEKATSSAADCLNATLSEFANRECGTFAKWREKYIKDYTATHLYDDISDNVVGKVRRIVKENLGTEDPVFVEHTVHTIIYISMRKAAEHATGENDEQA